MHGKGVWICLFWIRYWTGSANDAFTLALIVTPVSGPGGDLGLGVALCFRSSRAEEFRGQSSRMVIRE